jgi:hypothetical protein
MTVATAVNSTWIVTELMKLHDAERALSDCAKARAEGPPDEALGVVYHEISAADERHAAAIETIATRYGYTPSRGTSTGIGEALGRLKEKVVGLGSDPMERMAADLRAKAEAIHWYTAWIHTFEVIGDTKSGQELSAVLAEEQAHRDALQGGFNRLVEQSAQGEKATSK